MKKPEYNIRTATIDDCSLLAELHGSCFPRAWSETEFISFFDQGNVIAFLACDAQAPVGFFFGWRVADAVELLAIAVRADRRGEGIGHKLLQQAISAAREQGAQAIYLEVGVTNEAARKLYLAHGFTLMSRRKDYYRYADGTTEDAITMQLEI